jgi:type IV secretory pathway VirB4 component
LFTKGSLNVFAHPTNVNTKNRMVVYDILNLGSQLKTMGLLVITDAMINRVSTNWKMGKRTHIYIDELHVVFSNEYSSNFFSSAWRQFRKRNAYPTGITQNVEVRPDRALCKAA